MREYIYANVKLEHLLCALILIARLGDIVSTYLVTPTLILEANPIARKFRWPFAVATLLVCFVPYWNTGAGIIILVPSLLVSASNVSKIWFARAYGETAYYELLLRTAKTSKLRSALIPTFVSAVFFALVGLILLLLSNPQNDWGWWFAIGFLTHSMVIAVHGSLYIIRLFRTAKREPTAE